jgi:hypothetical protein
MEPEISINVEEAFGKFVKATGGVLISEILGPSPAFANADYLFRDEGVVAELKCLEKDVMDGETFQTRISAALEDWIVKGKIPPFSGRIQIHSASLPQDCQHELFNILRRPLVGAITKANQQIKATKAHLNLPHAKGLLLLVNNGCWSLESDAVLYLADTSLGDRFRSINSVVYFTVNMPARMPGIQNDALVWVPAGRKGIDPVENGFLDHLQRGWFAHYAALTHQPLPVFEEDWRRIADLRFVRRKLPGT